MPMDRSLYPKDWEAIALRLKNEANWICEKCGKVCQRPDESIRDFVERIRTTEISECPVVLEYLQHPRRWLLTVAHLDHTPRNCDRSNLRAWCAPCHARYDLGDMPAKVKLKQEREGQLNLLDPVDQLGLEHGPGGNGETPERTQLHLGDIGRVVR